MKKLLAICVCALGTVGVFGGWLTLPQNAISPVTVSSVTVEWVTMDGTRTSTTLSPGESLDAFVQDDTAVRVDVSPKNASMEGQVYYATDGIGGHCRSGESISVGAGQKLNLHTILAMLGGNGNTWAVGLSYEAVPEHVTMTLSGVAAFGAGTQIVHVVKGPADAGICPWYADSSEGWTVEMTADQGYAVPTFSSCPMRNKQAVRNEGASFQGKAVILYPYNELGCAVRIYDIATTNQPVYSTLSFDDGVRSVSYYASIRTQVGRPYGDLPTPAERTGYVFAGWYDADGQRVIATTLARVEGARRLKARWEAATLWVAFDGGVGATGKKEPVKLAYNDQISLPGDAFDREGYTFLGWLMGDSTSPIGSSYSYLGSFFAEAAQDGLTVLKAKWEAVAPASSVHTVAFDRTGWEFGDASFTNSSVIVTNGMEWVTVPDPVHTAEPDRAFLGWVCCTNGVQIPISVTGTVADDLPASVVLTPLWGETSIATALGCTGVFNFATNIQDEGGSVLTNLVGGWEIAVTDDGAPCMRTTLEQNALESEEYVNLSGQVKGPGRLSFKWRILSPRILDESWPTPNNWGKTREQVKFYTNDVFLAGAICGNGTAGDDSSRKWLAVTNDPPAEADAVLTDGDMGWQQVDLDVVADTDALTALRWCFRNSNAGKSGDSGFAYVKDVVWTGSVVTNDVVFDANGGTGTMASQQALDGRLASLNACTFAKPGATFLGWALDSSNDVVFADGATDIMVYSNVTLYAKWSDQSCTIRYEANGGTGTMPDQVVTAAKEAYLFPNVFKKAGSDFAGWATDAGGPVAYADIALQSEADNAPAARTLYAVWTAHRYAAGEEMPVTVYVNGVGLATSVVVGQTWDGAMPLQPEAPEGMEFEGWYTEPDGAGVRVTADTVVEAGITALYAHFVPGKPKPVFAAGALYAQVEPALVTEASVYDGRLLDATGTRLMGVVQVKLAKYSAAKDLAKVTATVTVLGGKKLSYKGGEWRKGSTQTSLTCAKDSRTLTVCLGTRGLTGTFGDFIVDGARNIFTSKEMRNEGEALLAKLKGAYALAYPVAEGWTALSVSVGSKGKAKVTGTVADGTKVSYSGQLLVGEVGCCVPVAFAKKTARAAVELWLSLDGDQVAAAAVADAVAGKVSAALADGTRFALDTAAFAALLPGTPAADQMPDGVPVAWDGRKLVVANNAKAGSAENPSRLKLSLAAKTGLLKGSFKAISDVGGRSKTTSVTVSGVVVDGVGYGSAQVKKAGSVAVQVAP